MVDYSIIVNNEITWPIILGRGLHRRDSLSHCLFCVQKAYVLLLSMSRLVESFMGSKFVETLWLLLEFYLQMTTFYFSGKVKRRDSKYEANFEVVQSNVWILQLKCPTIPSKCFYNNLRGVRRCYAQWSTSDYPLWLVEEGMLRSAFSKIWLEQQVFVKGRYNDKNMYCKQYHLMELEFSYFLPCSLMPTKRLLTRTYWWGHGGSTIRGIDWLSRDMLVVYKFFGGLGFKYLTSFN